MLKIFLVSLLSISLFGGIIGDAVKSASKGAIVYGAKKGFEYYKKSKKAKIFRKKEVNGRTIYQREIDPKYAPKIINKRTKKVETTSNAERMKKGQAPYVNKNGKPELVELHHSRQNDKASLFELSQKVHRAKTNKGAEALHPYRSNRGRKINNVDINKSGKEHPYNPVNRVIFDKERKAYWKQRAKDFLGE